MGPKPLFFLNKGPGQPQKTLGRGTQSSGLCPRPRALLLGEARSPGQTLGQKQAPGEASQASSRTERRLPACDHV